MSNSTYYIPSKATWPILLTLSLSIMLGGFASHLNGAAVGYTVMLTGFVGVILSMAGWFSAQATESESGMYSHEVGTSYRMGMMWFIFSEVMFFAVFFGTLYYTRNLSVPWLAGEGMGPGVNSNMLWPGFEAAWPTNGPAELGGEFEVMGPWGLPLINTCLLLSSGFTCTWAHHGLKEGNRSQLIKGLVATVALGFTFVVLQGFEYHEAYSELGLTLGSGVYGSTFFMLTGFHGFHVIVGALMLTTVLFRSLKGHFTAENHFAFEAAAWYWHFVDVVWLGLFIFVYWL